MYSDGVWSGSIRISEVLLYFQSSGNGGFTTAWLYSSGGFTSGLYRGGFTSAVRDLYLHEKKSKQCTDNKRKTQSK